MKETDILKTDTALWQRLVAFRFDAPGSDFKFSDRLMRENGWATSFARRVLEEYRKFLYLAMVSDTAVTPSNEVDQAWHLHMCYTRSYWQDLCKNTLGKPLHHGPTKGGKQERSKYRQQYEATLNLYQREFGESPPSDIWPTTESRFHPGNNFRWINARNVLVIPKSTTKVAVGLVGILFLLFGCYDAIFNSSWGVILLFLGFCGFLIWGIIRHHWGSKGWSGSSGCGTAGCGAGDDSGGDSGCGSGCSGCGGGCSGCGG